MRPLYLVISLLSLLGCTPPGTHWQKADTEAATHVSDLQECRQGASQEAMRLYASQRSYPFYQLPFWSGGWPSQSAWLRRAVETDQAQAERMLTASCMKKKGYATTTA